MEHAHPASAHDHILAALLEQGIDLPAVAKRVNMSLAALANWVNEHAPLLTNLHQLLVTRCKLLAAQLELAALSALATVSSNLTTSDDPKLRERALERCRKAANAILRHRTWLERTPRARGASGASHAPPSQPPAAMSSLDASMPHASVPSSSRRSQPAKPSLAHRLAARRLAAFAERSNHVNELV